MSYEPTIELDYSFSDFDDIQILHSYLAISALQAGYFPQEILVGYA